MALSSTGADDIKAVEPGLVGDAGGVAGKGEAVLGYGDIEQLGELVAVFDAADGARDLVLALGAGAAGDLVGQLVDQSTNVALVPGQDAYVKIESLDSWSTLVGAGYAAARDTFYARLMLPQIARSEIVQSMLIRLTPKPTIY